MSENIRKYDCNLVQDLLPLYQDNVCSDNSKKVVEEHLKECEKCRNVLLKLKNTSYDEVLSNEKNNVLDTHARKEKRDSTTAGIATAAILMIPVIVCLICNIAIGHALDWFFIVLASLLVFASVTVLPMLVRENRGLWTIAGFTTSLLLLFMVICIYTKGNWFFLVSVPVVFGLSVLLLPYILSRIPLPGALKNHKGLLSMIWDTIWLYAVIIVCGIYSTEERYWSIALPITTVSVLLPWGIFLIARYCKAHALIKAGIITIMVGVFWAFINDVVNRVLYGFWHLRIFDVDFTRFDTDAINGVAMLCILVISVVVGVILIAAGITLKKKEQEN